MYVSKEGDKHVIIATPFLANGEVKQISLIIRREEIVKNWNQLNLVGSPCVYENDFGSKMSTKTRSEAWLLGGHTPVVLVDRISACVELERITITKD